MKLKLFVFLVIVNNGKLLGQDSLINFIYKNSYLSHVNYSYFNIYYNNSIFKSLEINGIRYYKENNKLSVNNYLEIVFEKDYYDVKFLDSFKLKLVPTRVLYNDSSSRFNSYHPDSISYSYYYDEYNVLNEVIIKRNNIITKLFFNRQGLKSIYVLNNLDSNQCMVIFKDISENNKVIDLVGFHNHLDSSCLTIYNRTNKEKKYVKEISGFNISTKSNVFYCHFLFNKNGVFKKRYRGKKGTKYSVRSLLW